MIKEDNRFYIITGGPGVGKTTLINELNKMGFSTVPEDARTIIKEQILKGGDSLPWKSKRNYAQLMLDTSIITYQKVGTKQSAEITFFDRGILDAVCYMDMESIPVSEETINRITQYPCAKSVFLLPPWKEIYETDSERKQSWEEAVNTFDKMKATYLKYGYEVIELPKDTVENRCKFIQDFIK